MNALGADVGRQCLEAGVLDEILVLIVPVLLGGGTRMFAHSGRVALEPVHASHTSTTSTLRYRVRR